MPMYGPAWTAAEKAKLRRTYPQGVKAALRVLPGRSPSAIAHTAARLGLARRRHWTKQEDRILRSAWEQGIGPRRLTKKLRRKASAIYYRAVELHLTRRCPDGMESVKAAAKRTGYDRAQLARILAWAGVKMKRRPTLKQCKRPQYCVDATDVDEAIERWCRTETVEAAARRRDMPGNFLRVLLRRAGFDWPKGTVMRVTDADVTRALATRVRTGTRRRRG